MKIYISEEQMCQEINPIISEYTAHLGPTLLVTEETYAALQPQGQITADIQRELLQLRAWFWGLVCL